MSTNNANNETPITDAQVGAGGEEEFEIEGGFVSDVPEVDFDPHQHRTRTTSRLAFTFALILAGALVLHYLVCLTLALTGHDDAVTALTEVFNVWLPAIVGIVSSVATYYFSKER